MGSAQLDAFPRGMRTPWIEVRGGRVQPGLGPPFHCLARGFYGPLIERRLVADSKVLQKGRGDGVSLITQQKIFEVLKQQLQ